MNNNNSTECIFLFVLRYKPTDTVVIIDKYPAYQLVLPSVEKKP